jgi:hypothetical protein
MSANERASNGTLAVQPMDTAVGLGHEFVHVSHILNGTMDYTTRGQHVFSEGGITYVEEQLNEEFRAVGLGYNRRGDITENQLRRELGYGPRATYSKRDKWVIRK